MGMPAQAARSSTSVSNSYRGCRAPSALTACKGYPRNPDCVSGRGRPVSNQTHQFEQRLPNSLEGGASAAIRSLTPRTSEPGSAISAEAIAGRSLARCWPSASIEIAWRNERRCASSSSVWRAAPFPRFSRCLRSTPPALSATAPEPSVEPSSQTSTVEACSRAARTTSPTVEALLNTGTMTQAPASSHLRRRSHLGHVLGNAQWPFARQPARAAAEQRYAGR